MLSLLQYYSVWMTLKFMPVDTTCYAIGMCVTLYSLLHVDAALSTGRVM